MLQEVAGGQQGLSIVEGKIFMYVEITPDCVGIMFENYCSSFECELECYIIIVHHPAYFLVLQLIYFLKFLLLEFIGPAPTFSKLIISYNKLIICYYFSIFSFNSPS